ncbi:MAG: transporter permease [Bacteroidetes bacterium]|jgi:ABC-type antimicrobial peptide transport system permease subunit|nr:transporter permease [Bacteroidota bacterium]
MKIPFTYTWRSLWTRRLTTVLTLSGIALVAFVFASVLMLSRGVENTLIETGSMDNAIVIRKSATSELVSQIERDHANLIKTYPEVALLPDGKPFVSGETYVIINLLKRGSNDMGNISVRGISPEGLQLRPQVKLSAGRWFSMGTQEIVVGKNIATNFNNSAIGEQLRFGDALWTIVGHIDGGGTAFDSEIWGDVEQMMPAFGRPVFSSVTLRLKSPEMFDALKLRVEQDPRTSYTEVKREQEYYKEQSKFMSDFIRVLGLVVTIIFSIGAMIGAMITMYAAVANRTREIGTMRALGFRRRSILGAFLVESILLSLIGGAIGIGLASFMSLVRISTTNFGSFSELAFGFALAPDIIGWTLFFSVIMGIVGGFLPSVRASRLSILNALRSA